MNKIKSMNYATVADNFQDDIIPEEEPFSIETFNTKGKKKNEISGSI